MQQSTLRWCHIIRALVAQTPGLKIKARVFLSSTSTTLPSSSSTPRRGRRVKLILRFLTVRFPPAFPTYVLYSNRSRQLGQLFFKNPMHCFFFETYDFLPFKKTYASLLQNAALLETAAACPLLLNVIQYPKAIKTKMTCAFLHASWCAAVICSIKVRKNNLLSRKRIVDTSETPNGVTSFRNAMGGHFVIVHADIFWLILKKRPANILYCLTFITPCFIIIESLRTKRNEIKIFFDLIIVLLHTQKYHFVCAVKCQKGQV